jgi:putative heme-binding domain-containing protein
MSRSGATFETTDSRFLTSSDPDFHPTDVLADADGSLLVVDTGGWFIEGCPLSRVAKPDIPGGIYRIRKVDGAEIQNPWGRSIAFDDLSPDELVEYLSDERPRVRDQATEQLIATGSNAVGSLREARRSTSSEDVRTSVVFILYRIGTDAAMAGVRQGLSDGSARVRNAAARSVGLAGDERAVERLMEIVQDDQAPVRRQAGTALGQIGDPAAVPALIQAAEDPDDRFVEHAIIYSLIQLGETDPLVDALEHGDPEVRKAALIALDQIEDSPLRREQISPFLASENRELHEAGVWVAIHHPEWSDVVLDFLQDRLRDEDLSEEQERSASEVVVSFCQDTGVQQLVADLLGSSALPADRKKLLLGTIDQCSVEELPPRWVEQIGRLLRNGSPAVRMQALGLTESRQLKALTGTLEQIVGDGQEPLDFRIETLGALSLLRPRLSSEQFALLLEQLSPDAEAPIRQSAARILTQAELSEQQLVRLAEEYVGDADPIILSNLIGAFEENTSERVGRALAQALQQSPERLNNLSAADLDTLFSAYPPSVQEAAQPVMETVREQQKNRLQRLETLQARLTEGDVGEGREIFFGDRVICSACHAVGGEGGDFGPDLTNIGEIRSRHDLLEAIMYPSVSFAREYETYQVETSSDSYRGVIVEQTPEMVLLQTGQESRVRVPREEIVSMQQGTTSMMPPGLDQALSTQELSDLMAFLESLPGASRLERD